MEHHLEGINLIRALKYTATLGLLVLAAACNGGGGGVGGPDPTEQLALQLFAVSPATGTAPLNASLTAVVSGGQAPYDYAWDFENDGSFDAFDNNKFDTTVSRSHQYNLRAVDAGGASTYQALVRITDAAGTVLTSDPRSVTATSSAAPIPPVEGFIEDELGNQVDPAGHVFRSGERLRFHFGDSSVLTYQWDFDFQQIDPSKPLDQQVTPVNPTFSVDSTAVNPSHVFYNTGATPLIYIVQVRVRNPQTGEVATETFNITVGGSDPTGGDAELEGDISSNPSADSTGLITLRFDPTGNSQAQGIGSEPVLELSALVSAEPGKTGVPPYEFYWDFENDGKIDKAADSPTIPYYDSARKVTVNPYLHNEDERMFEVRLLIIDIKGHTFEIVRQIRSINVGNRPPAALSFTANWGFGTAPNLEPFVEVDGPADTKTGVFTIVPKGAAGFYEYKLDVNGDGLGDYDYVDTSNPLDGVPDTAKLVPGADDWIPVSQTGTTISVVFGPHPDPDDANNPPADINQFPLPRYYPAQAIVRALDAAGGNQIDELTRQLPVSLVQIGPTSNTTIDTDSDSPEVDQLPALMDHQMVPFNGEGGGFVNRRGVIITGGAQGTTALRDVLRIQQLYSPPINPGELETLTSTTVEELTPMTVARRGHTSFMFADQTTGLSTWTDSQVYSVGGRNPDVGPLASVEFMYWDPTVNNRPWVLSGSELNPTGSAFPLYDFGSAMDMVFDFDPDPNVEELHHIPQFVGGLNQQAKDANANVSGLTFQFGGFVEADPADDQWGTQSGTLGVPRYDHATVVIGTTMYAIGGRTASGQSVATVEKFDLSSDNGWVQLPNMQQPRAGHTAQVIDPDEASGPQPPVIYVYGGAFFPSTAGNRTLVTTAEVFNPVTQTWSYTVPLKSQDSVYGSYAGASARLLGPGYTSQAINGSFNTVWYYGGEIGQTSSQGETNRLVEFIYSYGNQ
jgi:hypothetical protein